MFLNQATLNYESVSEINRMKAPLFSLNTSYDQLTVKYATLVVVLLIMLKFSEFGFYCINKFPIT